VPLHHPLSVVLWRLDEVPRDTRVVLVCRHGYSSNLAAAQLQDLGFRDATDVEGGFAAWAVAGLPVDAVGPDR
jgi:rhodanese-related sulfurtransferase